MEPTRIHPGTPSTGHAGPQAARSKQAAAAAADAAPQGGAAAGFLALLAALEASPEGGMAVGQEALATVLEPEAPSAQADAGTAGPAPLQAGWFAPWVQGQAEAQAQGQIQGQVQPQLAAPDPALAAVPTAGLVQAGDAVQGAEVAGAVGAGSVLPGVSVGVGALGLQGGAFSGLVAQTARMDAAAGDGKLDAQGLAGDGARGKTAAAQRKGGGAAAFLAGAGAAADAAGAGRTLGGRLAMASGAGWADGAWGHSPVAAAAAAPGLLGGGHAVLRGSDMAPERLLQPLAPALADTAVAAAPAGAAAARQQDAGGGAASSDPQWSGALGTLEGGAQPSDLAADAQMPSFEEAIADELALWVDQNLQRAEVTVSHEGMPVEVSVSLQGNQAHVNFSADSAQTRALLDAEQAQLRALLQQHGLELAGLSVGVAPERGQAGAEGGQGREPQGGLPQGAQDAQALPGQRVGVRVLTDRAVDLYI